MIDTTFLLSAIVALGAASQDPAPAAPKAETSKGVALSLLEKPVASGLGIAFPALATELLELSTCEAVLVGDADLGAFGVAPKPEDWKRDGGAWSYSWTLPRDLVLQFRATPVVDGVRLEYTLRNSGKEALERVQVHPCLPTIGAPSFHPGSEEQARRGPNARAARAATKDWSELWSRLFVWREGQPFSFASSAAAKGEPHLAFAPADGPVTRWSWWKHAPETVDLPWIALRSRDGKRALALAFEASRWISSNVGDARACFHLFPWFGTLAPGETKTVRGELVLVEGDLAAVRARLSSDFPPPK